MTNQLPALGSLPATLAALPAVTVVCGHYGVGKTNFSINLAIDAARTGRQVTLIDMDVVNPYFRSSDYADLVEAADVKLIAPDYAGTALDTPVLSGAIEAAIDDAWAHPDRLLVIDAGGDGGRVGADGHVEGGDELGVVPRPPLLVFVVADGGVGVEPHHSRQRQQGKRDVYRQLVPAIERGYFA